jgi:hypothetical protein
MSLNTVVPPAPRTGVRHCLDCKCLYAAAVVVGRIRVCPSCRSENTRVVEPASAPRQTTLFTLPPPPAPNLWAVEWKWSAKPHGTYRWMKPDADWHPEEPNPWTRYSTYNVNCHKTAINQRARLSRCYPWRSFRVSVVGWTPVPLLQFFPSPKS